MDDCTDSAVNALATLAKHSVNAKFKDKIGTDAIKNVIGCPLPMSLLGADKTPCLAIYRLTDRNRDRGQWIFENQATIRFDYFAPATPLMRLGKRWPILSMVWKSLMTVMRVGSDPNVGEGANLLAAGGLSYVIENTQTAQYGLLPGAQNSYPWFQGTMSFVECMDPPAAFDPADLTPFEELWTDWDLKPQTNVEFEAQNQTKPPQG